MDPDVERFLTVLAERGQPRVHGLEQEDARDAYEVVSALLDGVEPDGSFVFETLAPLSDDRRVLFRVYVPASGGQLPIIVYLHGLSYSSGGWVVLSLDSCDVLCRQLAVKSRAVVVSVGYRLAEEYPYPEPLEDCLASIRWIVERAGALGGRADGLALAGSGTGANLATVAARKLRREGLDIAAQLVVCPFTDATMAHASHKEQQRDWPFLTVGDVRKYWNQYLPPEVARDHPDVSPLFAPDLEDVGSTFLITAGLDPLQEEGIAYGERLAAAGNDVVMRHYEKMIHQFLHFPNRFSVAQEALDEACEFMREVLTQNGDT